MTRYLMMAVAAAPLIWAGSASAMTMAPLSSPSHVTEVRTYCDQWGRCCATGSGECFDQYRRRRTYYEPRRYYAPPAYGYYREPYYGRRGYYGGPSVGIYGGW